MCDDRHIDNCRNTYKNRDNYRDECRDKYRDNSFDSDRGRSREKHCLNNARKVSNNSRLEQFCKVIEQLSPVKVMALRLRLASSTNFDDMLDRLHSLADVDHLIAEGIVYVKRQKAENLTKDIHYDESNVNHETTDSVNDEKDICLTQDSQEVFDFIDDDEVPDELIEGEVDNYSIELSIPYACDIDYQSIDKSKTTELQDVPIQVANVQEIEECVEEVVSDMTLPEMCSADEKIHTDELKLEMSKINAVEICEMPNETKSECLY